jgi:hypothetical protein
MAPMATDEKQDKKAKRRGTEIAKNAQWLSTDPGDPSRRLGKTTFRGFS